MKITIEWRRRFLFVDGDQIVLSQESRQQRSVSLATRQLEEQIKARYLVKLKQSETEGNTEDIEYYKSLEKMTFPLLVKHIRRYCDKIVVGGQENTRYLPVLKTAGIWATQGTLFPSVALGIELRVFVSLSDPFAMRQRSAPRQNGLRLNGG